ncbi:MAG: protein phosphatase 2C domain-containing protein [Pseudomonadota bacterium]
MGRLVAAASSVVGLLRQRNEDAWRIYQEQEFVRGAGRGFLVAVADGMGGGRAGSEAAWMAVDQLAHFYYTPGNQFRGETTLQDLFFRSNDAVTRLRTTGNTHYGMGTTIVAALFDRSAGAVTVFNIGDSAAFLWRSGRHIRLTTPHVNEAGELTNHIGMGPGLEIERVRTRLAPGDRLLLTSDGVHSYVDEEVIGTLLGGATPKDIATSITEAADGAGGKDNATALVAEVRPDPA